MARMQVLEFAWGYEKAFGYSQSVRVGDLILLAGQMPRDAEAKLVGEGDIKAQFLPGNFPAWTAIGVTALALPGQMIEIEGTAAAR